MMVACILIVRYGIEGAAIALAVRSILDTIILFYMAGRILKITYPKTRILLIASIVVALLSISMLLPEDLYFKLGLSLIALVFLFSYSWMKIMTSDERGFVLSYAKRKKTI